MITLSDSQITQLVHTLGKQSKLPVLENRPRCDSQMKKEQIAVDLRKNKNRSSFTRRERTIYLANSTRGS